MKKSEDILTVVELLKSISRIIYNVRTKLFAPYKITPVQAEILLDVYYNSSSTKITDICKRLNKTTNTISPLINRLVEGDILIKKQNKNDNRIFEVYFSSIGIRIMKEINEQIVLFSKPIFDILDDDEFKKYYELTNKLYEVAK